MDNGYGFYGHYDLLEYYNGYVYIFRSSRDDRFRLREGLYLKNKITTAEKRTKLVIIDR
jgi:hypothetical protein